VRDEAGNEQKRWGIWLSAVCATECLRPRTLWHTPTVFVMRTRQTGAMSHRIWSRLHPITELPHALASSVMRCQYCDRWSSTAVASLMKLILTQMQALDPDQQSG